MGAGDTDDFLAAVFHDNSQLTFAHGGEVQLAHLIALGQVGIEVVLAIEYRALADLGIDSQAKAHGLGQSQFIQYRQGARQGQVKDIGLGVGLGTKFGGAAGEQFGLRVQLHVDFEANDSFPFHDYASCPRPAGFC